MRIEIEVHEARTETGARARVRIVREIRELAGGGEESAELIREHDGGTELLATEAKGVYQDSSGRRIRLVRRIA